MEWTMEYLHSIADKEKLSQNRFQTISDFKWCMKQGGEVGFAYNSRLFGVSHTKSQIIIYEVNKEKTTTYFDTADEALEYIIDDIRLRDIISKVEVFDRTI